MTSKRKYDNSALEGVEEGLKNVLQECFQSLNMTRTRGGVTDEQISEWASFIHHSMMTPCRLYHNAEHVLEVLGYLGPTTDDPITRLAVLFHDIVYYSLEKKLSVEQAKLLNGMINQEEEDKDGESKLELTSGAHDDPTISMVCSVFDFDSEGPIRGCGVNEFWSTLVAVRTLKDVLSQQQLLQLAMAIEATIPFRGTGAMDRLYERSLKVYPQDDTTASGAETFVTHAVQQAVLVSYADLGAFSNPDPTVFLDSNWRLLPEWFPNLIGGSVKDFQSAFRNVLDRPMDVTKLFMSFREFPTDAVVKQKQQQATDNLQFLREHMVIRLLSVTMILQLAELGMVQKGHKTNGSKQQPLSVDIPLNKLASIEQKAVERLGATNGHKDATRPPVSEQERLHHQLLAKGRRHDYPWDAKQAPLAAVLFQKLGCSTSRVKELLALEGTLLPKSLPDTLVSATLEALTEVLDSTAYSKERALE